MCLGMPWPLRDKQLCPRGMQTQQPGDATEAAPAGPTSFANLRQLTGLPAGGAKASKPAGGSSLVSRLAAPKHRPGKEPLGSQGAGSSEGLDAANYDAVFGQVIGGVKKK
jgi:hypothetical protein